MTRVAVIDDDPSARTRVVRTLQLEAYEAASAPDGASGIALVRDWAPDLVLCDVNMPDMDGFGVLESLKASARTADTPFVFMTARVERNDMRRGMELGADDYLTKPFTTDELMAAVETQVTKRQTIARKYETTIELLRKNIVYALPHELRTPLTGSLGYAELLRMDAESHSADEIREIAGRIVAYNNRLQRVLENFLAYAQVEVLGADAERLGQLRNHITAQVGKAVEVSASNVAEGYQRRADLVLEIQEFAARIASADLRKIVEELVDNAFKFSQHGSLVTVCVERDAAGFCIEVTDQGRGMSDEQVGLMGVCMQFDRMVYEQQGLGFGFIIAKRLTELHRGHLAIHSEVGTGTSVQLRFPFHP